MLLRWIKLTNFRQYRGVHTIHFSTHPQKNVTVILGDNTSGKTTLVQAFNWVLYGSLFLDNPDQLLNLDLAYELEPLQTKNVEVELGVAHNGVDYTIAISQTYRCDMHGEIRSDNVKRRVFVKEPNGQSRLVRAEDIKKIVTEILPEELSSYFFFDGERIETIGNRKDLTEAVKRLLGLTVLENARQHLNPMSAKSVIGKLRKNMDLASDQKSIDAVKGIEDAEADIERLTGMRSQYDEEIANYEDDKQRLEGLLQENQETAALQRERKRIENLASDLETKREAKYQEFRKLFNMSAVAFFARPLIVDALGVLADVNLSDVGIPNMSATAIDHLIQRGRCVCGARIDKGSEAHQHLLSERTMLPPESLGTVVRSFRRQAMAYNDNVDKLMEAMTQKYQEVASDIEAMGDLHDESADLDQKLAKSLDMSGIEEQLQAVRLKLRGLASKKEQLLVTIGGAEQKLRTFQRQHESQQSATDKNRRIRLQIEYANEIFNWLEETYLNRGQQIRSQLEARVSQIFSEMYHGNRTVSIDDRYRVVLGTSIGSRIVSTPQSGGLETVKNFAFVAGLLDLARAKIGQSTGAETADLNAEPYPLVMDAPFSKADERHVASISAVLPTIAEQVIMVVMAKDWHYAEPTLSARVGQMYEIAHQTETLSTITEVTASVR